jgi:hypothetical protein
MLWFTFRFADYGKGYGCGDMSDLLIKGVLVGLVFMVLFVLVVSFLGRGIPAILRLVALWIWIACKRTVRALRLLARMIEQTRRQKDKVVRQRFERECTRRLRGPKQPQIVLELDNVTLPVSHSGGKVPWYALR